MMVQPKAPPLSIRPGDERMALIDAHAQKRGITRHAAVLELIDAGLVHKTPAPSKPAATTMPSKSPAKSKPKPSASFTPREDTYPDWMRKK